MSITIEQTPTTRDLAAAARWGAWRRRLLIGIVVAYMAVLVLAPIGALVSGAWTQGIRAIIGALNDPQVLGAFSRTLLIALVAVVVHGICGTALAWVLVRQRFPGRRILNGLLDLPFAISPVVAGYMLLLLFGRQGLFAPALNALDIRIAFALPGMIIATLFVTLPFMVRELMPVLHAFGIEQEQAA
jgi:sulfate/thiosulfate transport system permease protein